MSLVAFFVVIVIAGLVFYLLDTYLPMSPPFRTTLRVIGVLVAILLVLSLIHLPLRLF